MKDLMVLRNYSWESNLKIEEVETERVKLETFLVCIYMYLWKMINFINFL